MSAFSLPLPGRSPYLFSFIFFFTISYFIPLILRVCVCVCCYVQFSRINAAASFRLFVIRRSLFTFCILEGGLVGIRDFGMKCGYSRDLGSKNYAAVSVIISVQSTSGLHFVSFKDCKFSSRLPFIYLPIPSTFISCASLISRFSLFEGNYLPANYPLD